MCHSGHRTMADDRTVAPTPARVRKAWKAGTRAPHRWLTGAAAVWVTTWWLAARSPSIASVAGEIRRAMSAPDGPDAVAVVTPLVVDAAVLVAWVSSAVVAAWLLVGLVTGTLGPVRRMPAAPRAAPADRWTDGVWPALALATVWLCAAVLAPVLAGAARAPGASLAGLEALWHAWAVRIGVVTGGALAAAGLVEHAVERRRLVRRLHASPEQLAQERRDAGGRGR
jgi:hypothetical protein